MKIFEIFSGNTCVIFLKILTNFWKNLVDTRESIGSARENFMTISKKISRHCANLKKVFEEFLVEKIP